MKKIASIIVIILLIFTGFFSSGKSSQIQEKGGKMDKKILTVYFSWGGNTKFIAQKIHSKMNGDIFSIEPLEPYPNDYQTTTYGIAKEQHEKNIHPPIKNSIDINDYDIIFVGTPAWWGTMAPPVMTFLEENNFEGKTVAPFITHGGGGEYAIEEDMKKLTKGAEILTPFVVYEKGNSKTDEELENWLKNIK